ncbi:cupin domain-containing protein [Micromonospora sp. WMMD1102]|uniref:cupin domain-containing protein n=1 Tax=Micromonospora sp. WMMD1102 TaxID=3016105 RepID=UPI00241560A7|nr:cupin domain-containing protein [Micromonospora sp. WMMD1102]MDG4786494.1 cupin domain-containing protein [Micromonospora sp. WMMD1102]
MAEFPVPVNLAERLGRFTELWAQKKVADLNDYEIKIAKVKGEFVWHRHPETDEFFLVVSGRLTIRMRDGDVVLGPGELFVVPRDVEHCPVADEETAILLVEPAGTLNTGTAGGPLTRAAEALTDPVNPGPADRPGRSGR